MHRFGNHFAAEVRGEQFDEVVGVAAQVFVLAYRDTQRVEFLFERYQQLTSLLPSASANKTRKSKAYKQLSMPVGMSNGGAARCC